MTKDELIEQIHEYVINSKLKEALNTLKQIVTKPDLLNMIIILMSTIQSIQQAEITDTEEERVLRKKKNKVKLSILEILNEITLENSDKPIDANSDILEELLDDLEIINQAFVAQCRLRDQLLNSLKRRFSKRRFTHFVKIFSQYYDEMSPNELRTHKTIRGYTKNIIMEYNMKVLDVLKANSTLKDEIPRLKNLEQHIIIWKSKYDSTFVNDMAVNLVYVGVEERVPFPKGIENDIRIYLKSKK